MLSTFSFKFRRIALVGFFAVLALSGCGDDGSSSEDGPEQTNPDSLTRMFPTEENPGESYEHCLFTSPHRYADGDDSWVIVSRAAGIIEAVNPETGASEWSVELPEPDQGEKFLLSTPAKVGNHLVVAYHARTEDSTGAGGRRMAHLVAVVDLQERKVDEDFPVVELQAEVEANEPGETVSFRPRRALTRPRIVHGIEPDDDLGRVYITQGNARDIQPWHGWAWEIDLDAWRNSGADAAISGVLNTTPEPDDHCGEPGTSGSRERLCGGGLWAPSGQLIVPEEDGGYHVILAPGNGQLNVPKRDYANTLMKVQPGLEFDHGCNMQACSDFNPDRPSDACMESCSNLFIPRRLPGQEIPKPSDGRCSDRDTMFSCWEEIDYIGGSTPVRVELGNDEAVFAYPTKDGYAYLVDADQMGRMYDRHQMVDQCGDGASGCRRFWAGMSVTKPAKTTIDGQPAVLITTFMPDDTNPAGVVALKIVHKNGEPTFERAWEYPDFESEEAVERFRRWPTRIRLDPDGDIAWMVDVKNGSSGTLIGIDIETGEAIVEKQIDGWGRRYILPLIHEDRIYVQSCQSNRGPGQLEGYRIESTSQ